MSFGRNPHVAKAELAEQKAETTEDPTAAAQHWRDAARLWERAGEREMDGKRRALFAANAERARASADGQEPEEPSEAPEEYLN